MRGTRQIIAQRALHRHRAGARTATAVGRRKGFVQVHVQHIHAHVPRLGDAHQRVEIGTVQINHPAFGVHDFGDRFDVGFEQAQAYWDW